MCACVCVCVRPQACAMQLWPVWHACDHQIAPIDDAVLLTGVDNCAPLCGQVADALR